MYEIIQTKEHLKRIFQAVAPLFPEQILLEIKVLSHVLLLKFKGAARFFSKQRAADLAKIPISSIKKIGANTVYKELPRSTQRAKDSLLSAELKAALQKRLQPVRQ